MAIAIVHHTVNTNFYGPGDSIPMLRGIYAYHVYTLGYCDIAYNFLIDQYGVPFEGRWGGIDSAVVGAHAIGANGESWNNGTTGIAMLGTYSDSGPPSAALGTLIDLLVWKFHVHDRNPWDDPLSNIIGHRDTGFPTECPGNALYSELPAIRDNVRARY